MNCEILFRGKRVDNGEWVFGDLIREPHGVFIQQLDPVGTDGWKRLKAMVDPSTVGQYTGLTDKNGRRVFLGDIVNCSCGCPHEVILDMEHGGTFFGGMPSIYLSGLRDGYAWTGDEEIIGNIHDNRWEVQDAKGDTN